MKKNMQFISMINLSAQQKIIRKELDLAISKVLDQNDYILGSKVTELEQSLLKFCGAKHAISCANGTDALTLVLMAQNLTTQDVVFVPAFTFTATVEAVVLAGATPIFVDVLADSFNLNPNSLEEAILLAKKLQLNPVGMIPVDLFGLPADYTELSNLANKYNLWILSDAAQSFGASYFESKVGNLGIATSTSFFPSKPLGCYGDGGCIFTNQTSLAENLRSIRFHGVAVNGANIDRSNTIRLGTNSRLDTIQAAILLEKIKIFTQELALRDNVAKNYHNLLKDSDELILPQVPSEYHKTSSWAQYTIKLNAKKLDLTKINNKSIQVDLMQEGIASMIYYPKPISHNIPYLKYPRVDLSIAEHLPKVVLSLPMHPYLTLEQQQYIANAIIASLHFSKL